MGKRLTDKDKARLSKAFDELEQAGASPSDMDKFASDFLNKYGVDDAKVQPITPKVQQPTQQPNLTQNINQTLEKGFGVESVKPKVEEQKPIVVPKPTYAEEDNNSVLLNAYRGNSLLPQSLSDEDALKVIAENKKKYNPEIVSTITEGARDLDIKRNEIANSNADEILSKASFKKQELLNADIQDQNVYNQSREAKVADIIGRVKSGLQGEKDNEVVSKDEVKYLISVAPKAYQSLMQEYNPNNSNNIYDVISNYNEKAKTDRVATANARAQQIYKLLPSDWIDENGGVTESTLLAKHKEFNENYAKSVSDLEAQYPMQYRMQHTGDGEQPREIGRGAEFNYKLEELNNQKAQVNSIIAEANGLRYVQEKNKISGTKLNALQSPIEVGEQIFKLKEPDRYKVYEQGGKIDRGTTEEIQRLGINSLYASNDRNAIELAYKDEKKLNESSLDLENDTYNRIGAEIYKQGGVTKYFITPRKGVDELDKIVEQLPYPNRKMWYDKLRAIEQNQTFGTNIPMGGGLNKVAEGFMTTADATANALSSLTNNRDAKDIANDALAGQDNKYSNVGETKKAQQTKAELEYKLKNKEQLTYQELQDYNNASELLGTKSGTSKFLDGSGALIGQVLFQAIGTKGLGAVGKNVLGKAGLLAEEATIGSMEANIANSVGELGLRKVTIDKLAGAYLGYASSIDQAKQEAKLLMPDSETKQAVYANVVGLLNAATEHIFQDQKLFDPFKKELSGTIVNIVNELSTSNMSREALAGSFKKALLASKDFGLAVVKNNQAEAVEEVATQVGTSLALSILAPDKFNNKEEYDKIISTYTQTTTDGLILAGVAGGKEHYANRVGIPLLTQLGTNNEIYTKVIQGINAKVENKEISELEGNEKKFIASAIRDVHKTSMPKVDEISPNLKAEDRQKYAVILANEYVIKKKIENEKDDVIKAKLQAQVKESEAKRSDILDKKLTTGDNYELLTIEEANEKARLEAESKKATQAQTEIENKQAYDFDGTLFDNVKGELTPLGEVVKQRIARGEDIKIVTARKQDNTQEIETKLGTNNIIATGNEGAKGAELDKLGIDRSNYYDSDTKKLENIQNKANDTPQQTPQGNNKGQQVLDTESTKSVTEPIQAEAPEIMAEGTPNISVPKVEPKPLIEVPNNKTDLDKLVSDNKGVFGDFKPKAMPNGKYRPLDTKKAKAIIEKYNSETEASNKELVKQNASASGVVFEQPTSASDLEVLPKAKTIEQIDAELEVLYKSISGVENRDELKKIAQQQKQLKVEKQQIVDAKNTEISKPFDDKITALKNEVDGFKKDIKDEGYEGSALLSANTQIEKLNAQIKVIEGEKQNALNPKVEVQNTPQQEPISPSGENGNAQTSTYQPSFETPNKVEELTLQTPILKEETKIENKIEKDSNKLSEAQKEVGGVDIQEEIANIKAKRDLDIRELSKERVKITLPTIKDIVNSKDPIGNKAKYDALKQKITMLDKLINCL